MRKWISAILTVLLLFLCICSETPNVYAAEKAGASRTISIVFDNSGSMYDSGDQAWCRATYAMEVFASMLNTGDTLLIYPMHPIKIGAQEYTMESPYRITDSSQASTIRDIFTEDAAGTPIESIDCAIEDMPTFQSDKKYLIVLTDGGTFSKNGSGLSKERTKVELDKRVQASAGPDMTVMYLGIGSSACMPTTEQSEFFVKKQAVNSEDVLSTLTEMCNQVFGRDSLPKNHISGKTIDFDISMSKVIVFVQGENISGLTLKAADGTAVANQTGTQQTKYSTAGSADYKSVPDTSLQGMMVTYADCAAGSYTIEYSGNASSVEVYYEPDADLDFLFTDADGNMVDPNELYAGDYKVSFGMKDAKTGQLISSDLLGNPHYSGSYFINGEEFSITHDGYSGEVPVTLAMGNTFDAKLTATYLSGYTITKDASDFGWPPGGIQVTALPPGKPMVLKLSIENDYILIPDLDDSDAIVAALSIGNQPLTPEDFALVNLQVDTGGIEYDVSPSQQDSSFLIQLKPTEGVKEGDYKIKVSAAYTDLLGRELQADDTIRITLSNTPLWLVWTIRLLALLILFIIIWLILHIKVLPKYAHTSKKLSSLIFDGDNVTQATTFSADIRKNQMKVQSKYGGKNFGIVMDVSPGKESYLRLSQHRRSAEVKVASVRKFGAAKIQEAMVGSTKYVADETTGKLTPVLPNTKPFLLKNGMMVKYSGTIQDAGIDKDFEVSSKLNFRKK